MAVNVTLNGVSYSIPDPGDNAWGQDLTDYFVAQASGLLQKAGGNFTLTAEVDFGATYGLKSAYFKSRASNLSTAGVLRLSVGDLVSWRNNANNGNLSLGVDGSDRLTFNGTAIQPVGNYITALTGDVAATGPGSAAATIQPGVIVNSMISNAAAIAYSKLALSGSIVNADISASAAIAYSKLALSNSIVDADISTSAAVANSKLAQMANNTLKGNVSGGSATPSDLTATQATALLNAMVGDSGSGGTKGLVPAPAAGDAAAGKVLKADGTWTTVGAGTVTSVALTMPAEFSVAGTPVTSAGTLAVTKATQTAGTFYAGPTSGSAAVPTFRALQAPTIQKFTATGTTTGYLFTISTSSTVAVSDTYTNNGNTYTVLAALAAQSGQVLFCSGASAPQASGTLTRATGAGTASITFTVATALATYTRAAGSLYLRVRMAGGGGGGGGGGTSGGAGTAGTLTAFGSSFLIATGGAGGANNQQGAAGGTATIPVGASGLSVDGGSGSGGVGSATGIQGVGGMGGSNPFGPGSGGGYSSNSGRTVTGYGAGGGGGGATSATPAADGSGGGAGAFFDVIISSPSASYFYLVGTGGGGGSAGTGGAVGATGGNGVIEVTEYYQ